MIWCSFQLKLNDWVDQCCNQLLLTNLGSNPLLVRIWNTAFELRIAHLFTCCKWASHPLRLCSRKWKCPNLGEGRGTAGGCLISVELVKFAKTGPRPITPRWHFSLWLAGFEPLTSRSAIRLFLRLLSTIWFLHAVRLFVLGFRPQHLSREMFPEIWTASPSNLKLIGGLCQIWEQKIGENRAFFHWNNALVQPQTAAIGGKLERVCRQYTLYTV